MKDVLVNIWVVCYTRRLFGIFRGKCVFVWRQVGRVRSEVLGSQPGWCLGHVQGIKSAPG